MSVVTEIPFSQPLVSVVMLTYNHAPYIKQSIDSILQQQVEFGVELVIGEDCSTDGTAEYVQAVAKQYPAHVRLITSPTNVGARKNGERTARACRGQYIAYCEGDDYWNDMKKLARQVAFLADRPDYSMVHTHCNRYFVTKKQFVPNSLSVPRNLDDANAYEDLLLERRCPLTVTVMTRRELLFRLMDHCPECTDPTWPMGDTQRWLELSRLGKVGCIHEPLATTNVLAESAGQSRDLRKRLRFYLKARELKLHYLKKYPIEPGLARIVREKVAFTLLQQAFDAGDYEVAQDMYADYRANCDEPLFRAKWLLWGSQTPVRKQLVRPLKKATRIWAQVQRRLQPSALDTP
jgi:glycosyltransferase involved in cell wall biosynthesis